MRNKYIFGFFIIGMVAIATILWIKYDATQQAEAYKSLIAGNVGLVSISFEGGRRVIKTDDRSILHDFENAFGNKNKLLNRNGITYIAVFILKNGAKIRTDVYIYDDKSGFSMADYSRLGAGDPTYVDVEFQKETTKKTQELIGDLLVPARTINSK